MRGVAISALDGLVDGALAAFVFAAVHNRIAGPQTHRTRDGQSQSPA